MTEIIKILTMQGNLEKLMKTEIRAERTRWPTGDIDHQIVPNKGKLFQWENIAPVKYLVRENFQDLLLSGIPWEKVAEEEGTKFCWRPPPWDSEPSEKGRWKCLLFLSSHLWQCASSWSIVEPFCPDNSRHCFHQWTKSFLGAKHTRVRSHEESLLLTKNLIWRSMCHVACTHTGYSYQPEKLQPLSLPVTGSHTNISQYLLELWQSQKNGEIQKSSSVPRVLTPGAGWKNYLTQM